MTWSDTSGTPTGETSGAAAIHTFSWVFYLFAAVLIMTAVNLARQDTGHDEEFSENAALRLLRRVLPVTPDFHGARSLLSKLVYLSYGLSVILGFLGVKLVLEALHENTLAFVNDGQPVPVPTIGIALSLSVIVGVLAVTTSTPTREGSANRPPASD